MPLKGRSGTLLCPGFRHVHRRLPGFALRPGRLPSGRLPGSGTQIIPQVQVGQHPVPDQDVVQFLVQRCQLWQNQAIESTQTHLFCFPDQLQMVQAGMKCLANEGRPQRIMVAGSIGNTQLVQAQFQLQKCFPVARIGPGHHDPQSEPLLKLALVHQCQLRGGYLNRRDRLHGASRCKAM